MNEDVVERMSVFCEERDGFRGLNKVGVRNGLVYASDGRIAFRMNPHMKIADEAPEKYPFDQLDRIVDKGTRVSDWFNLDVDQWDQLEAAFCEEMQKILDRQKQEAVDRFMPFSCPHCGNVVYWDTISKDVVSPETKNDILEPVNARDVDMKVRLFFGGLDGRTADFSFGYLHLVVKAFGPGVMVSLEHVSRRKHPMLFIRSSDGYAMGALMPLQTPDGYAPRNVIVAHRC